MKENSFLRQASRTIASETIRTALHSQIIPESANTHQ